MRNLSNKRRSRPSNSDGIAHIHCIDAQRKWDALRRAKHTKLLKTTATPQDDGKQKIIGDNKPGISDVNICTTDFFAFGELADLHKHTHTHTPHTAASSSSLHITLSFDQIIVGSTIVVCELTNLTMHLPCNREDQNAPKMPKKTFRRICAQSGESPANWVKT